MRVEVTYFETLEFYNGNFEALVPLNFTHVNCPTFSTVDDSVTGLALETEAVSHMLLFRCGRWRRGEGRQTLPLC